MLHVTKAPAIPLSSVGAPAENHHPPPDQGVPLVNEYAPHNKGVGSWNVNCDRSPGLGARSSGIGTPGANTSLA